MLISFEEFKNLYNAAIDDKNGKRKKAPEPIKGKDSKALDSGTLALRKQKAEEGRQARAAEEARYNASAADLAR